MLSGAITLTNLGLKMFEASKSTLGKYLKKAQDYLKAETEKLAVTMRMIIAGRISGDLSEKEAKFLFNQQKVASAAVLTTVKGIGIITAQNSINAALQEVKDFVNGKVGFELI